MKLVFVYENQIRQVMENVSDLEIDGDKFKYKHDGEEVETVKGKSEIYVLDDNASVEDYAAKDKKNNFNKKDRMAELEAENFSLKMAIIELDMKVSE